MHELSFQPHIFCLPVQRLRNVVLREDGDDVAGLKFKILRSVVVEHQLAKIEGNQRCGHGVWIQPLDDRVVPVGFKLGTKKSGGGFVRSVHFNTSQSAN